MSIFGFLSPTTGFDSRSTDFSDKRLKVTFQVIRRVTVQYIYKDFQQDSHRARLHVN